MRTAPDTLFKSFTAPTRRAIFERLRRDSEQTVRMMTDDSGVSQPAVSKHLGVLKLAGLVRKARGTPDPLRRPAARAEAPHRLDEGLRQGATASIVSKLC